MTLESLFLNTVDFFFKHTPQKKPSIELLKKCKIIAHRGDHINFKENTLDSFESCLKSRIYGIEFDVRWTKDNVPIVCHDINAQRVFHRPEIVPSQMTFKQLQSAIPQIPSLQQVVDHFGKKLHLMIELKKPVDHFEDLDAKIQILQKILKPLSPVIDFHIMCIEIENFKLVPFIDPKAWLSISLNANSSVLIWTLQNKIGGYTGHYLFTTQNMVNELKAHSCAFATGFVNSQRVLFRQASLGGDWIYSNNAVEVQKMLDQLIDT